MYVQMSKSDVLREALQRPLAGLMYFETAAWISQTVAVLLV
jgi:hypothetical protein